MKSTHVLGAPLAEDSIIAISYNKKKPSIVRQVSVGPQEPADFETAISATGFGKYNYLLLFVCMPSALSNVFATTTMSFILSDAQCDLSLSLEDKGMLNAITYIGMISSAFLWGMIGDNFGRRTVLLYAYSLDTIVCLFSAFSKYFWMLLVAKYISGFLMCGPNVVFMSFLSEFHCSRFRAKIITIAGVYFGIAKVLLPLLAWGIMPLRLNISIVEGIIELKSWQIYLIICCIPSLLAGVVHFVLPETPKFLMTQGKNEEALELFRKIYTKNTGNPPKTFPFPVLIDETLQRKSETNITNEIDTKSSSVPIIRILKQIKSLFLPPYLLGTFLLSSIQFGGLLGGNTLRLWLPQLFSTMDEYNQAHNYAGNATLCEMLDYSPKYINNENTNFTIICTVPEANIEVYINNMIVPLCSIAGFFILGGFISKIGKKTILVIQYMISAVLVVSNYWAKNAMTTVILSSFFLTFASICTTTSMSVIIEVFPTNIRTMAVSIALLCGRTGSILGNVLFPILLYSGCLPPFLFIGGFTFMCGCLSLMLPGTEKKPLK